LARRPGGAGASAGRAKYTAPGGAPAGVATLGARRVLSWSHSSTPLIFHCQFVISAVPAGRMSSRLLLFRGHFRPFLPGFGQAYGDRLLGVFHFSPAPAALELSPFRLTHGFFHCLLSFSPVLSHSVSYLLYPHGPQNLRRGPGAVGLLCGTTAERRRTRQGAANVTT